MRARLGVWAVLLALSCSDRPVPEHFSGDGQSGEPCEVDQDCVEGSVCFGDVCVQEGQFRVSLSWDRVTDFDLIRAFQKVLSRFEDSRELGEIVDDRFTVSDKIDYLLTHIEPGRSLRFIELFERATSRTEVIVTFLALLELIKLRQFRVEQSEALGEISITRSENAGRLDEDDYAGIDEA